MSSKGPPDPHVLLAVVRGCAREARWAADDEAEALGEPDEVCEAVAVSLEQLVIVLEELCYAEEAAAAEAAPDN